MSPEMLANIVIGGFLWSILATGIIIWFLIGKRR